MAKLGSLESFIKMHSLINSLQNFKGVDLWVWKSTVDYWSVGKVAQGISFDGEVEVVNEEERSTTKEKSE